MMIRQLSNGAPGNQAKKVGPTREQAVPWLALLLGSLLLSTVACMLFLPPRGPLKFEPATLPEAQIGVPYEAKVTISGNVTPTFLVSLVDGTLPAGLKFEKIEGEDAGLISGTPEEAGVFPFKIIAYCYGTNVNGQQGEQDYSLTVK